MAWDAEKHRVALEKLEKWCIHTVRPGQHNTYCPCVFVCVFVTVLCLWLLLIVCFVPQVQSGSGV